MQDGLQHISPPHDMQGLPEHTGMPFMPQVAYPPQQLVNTFYNQQHMGFSRTPPTPLSISLSASPPGSTSSRTHGIAPYLVTPGSSNVSPLSDTMGIYYSPPGYQMMPPSTMGVMPPGAPYPIPHPRPAASIRPPLRVLARNKRKTSGASVKAEDDDELEDLEEETPRGALGLRSIDDDFNENEGENAGDNKESVRRMRIESEQQKKQRLTAMWQRRRTEMRAGFDRLRDVLPASTQRSSKTVILDRAVGHIQQIELANRYLADQHDKDQRELQQLRHANQQLIAAVSAGRVHDPSS
ncbi:hypothetical protein Q5752_002449 [Cryptotrichosporon argae]